MNCPRTLIVTSCTGEKKFKPDNQLKQEDFRDRSLLKSRSGELAEYICDAGSIYTGMQHLRLMEGVTVLRQQLDKEKIDVAVVSAGYGVIAEEEKIVPYEVTFNNMKLGEVDEWSKFLDIHQDFADIIADYELVFVLLGEKYLRALKLPVTTNSKQTFIFLTSAGSKKYIKIDNAKSSIISLSNADAKKYGYGLVGLKGFLFKQFAERAVENPDLLDKVYYNPEYFKQIIDETDSTIHKKIKSEDTSQPLQLELSLGLPKEASQKKGKSKKSTKAKVPKKRSNANSNDFLPIPDLPPAPNTHLGMKYFIPEWDDTVDPGYDFLNDILTPGRDTYEDEVYAHQIYPKPNYDGILVSKIIVEKTKKKKAKIEDIGIHKYIRFDGEIMGDCGAFGYIEEEVPPYNTEEILEYYENTGFNYGISIDHLIVGGFAEPGIREKRYELSIRNAEDFLTQHRKKRYTFTPIGAVQGWSPETYADAVKAYIEMGYDYLAIGGVARSPSKQIIEILKAIYPYLKENTKVHLLGVARHNAIPVFRHLGITSFDSASPLRRAWLGAGDNYNSLAGGKYAAIRIPPVDGHGVRVKRVIEAGVATKEVLKQLEQDALSALRRFDAGKMTLEDALERILAYDELVELPRDGQADPVAQAKRRAKHEAMYRTLLQDSPWKTCDCVICNEVGVEVVIFRGNNRNRRRGFHNTYAFYGRFQALLEKLSAEKSDK